MMNRIIEKYKTLKREYLARTPREKWKFVRNVGRFLLIVVGVPVLNAKFYLDWYSFVPLAAIIDFFASTLYTFWHLADEPIKALLPISCFGIVIPVNTDIVLLHSTSACEYNSFSLRVFQSHSCGFA